MGNLIYTGTILKCSFGTSPSCLSVAFDSTLNSPVAKITDNVPLLNIMPFGMCTSLVNPTVASATSSMAGILTPMPCIPCTATLWINAKVITEALNPKSVPVFRHRARAGAIKSDVSPLLKKANEKVDFHNRLRSGAVKASESPVLRNFLDENSKLMCNWGGVIHICPQ